MSLADDFFKRKGFFGNVTFVIKAVFLSISRPLRRKKEKEDEYKRDKRISETQGSERER